MNGAKGNVCYWGLQQGIVPSVGPNNSRRFRHIYFLICEQIVCLNHHLLLIRLLCICKEYHCNYLLWTSHLEWKPLQIIKAPNSEIGVAEHRSLGRSQQQPSFQTYLLFNMRTNSVSQSPSSSNKASLCIMQRSPAAKYPLSSIWTGERQFC